MIITAVLLAGAIMLAGAAWRPAVAAGLALALSSTAIVLQTLNEKGLMKSDGGQSSFSVLLFQDIAVIPMLAFIPLLAIPELAEVTTTAAHGAGESGHASLSLVDRLDGWQRALVTAGAIGLVVVGGSYLTRPVFRFIAIARLRELFTAFALLLVVGIVLARDDAGARIALVKYSRGGTSLLEGASGYGNWEPDSELGGGINQYDHALATLRNALSHADIDGDGDLDAWVANSFDEPNRVWLNDGNGAFSDSGQVLVPYH